MRSLNKDNGILESTNEIVKDVDIKLINHLDEEYFIYMFRVLESTRAIAEKVKICETQESRLIINQKIHSRTNKTERQDLYKIRIDSNNPNNNVSRNQGTLTHSYQTFIM